LWPICRYKDEILGALFKTKDNGQRRGSKMEKIGFKNKFYLGPFQKYFIVFCCKYYMFITHVRHLNKLSGFI